MPKTLFFVKPVEPMMFDCEYVVLAETEQEAADLWIEGILKEDLSSDLGEVCDPRALERGLELRAMQDVLFEGPSRVLDWSEMRPKSSIVSITESKAWKEALAKGFDPETQEWDDPGEAPSHPE